MFMKNDTPKLMLLSIFVDEWNVFTVPMLGIFLIRYFNADAAWTGILTGATLGGAAIGSILGGIINDSLGRRKSFLINNIIFIIAAIASLFSRNVLMFTVSRFIAGFPVGSDIPNVYSYIMESSSPGKREYFGTMNTEMATLAILSINSIILLMLLIHLSKIIWRLVIFSSVIPNIILLINYNRLDNISVNNHGYINFIKKLRENNLKWHATLYSWICGICSSVEVSTFAFFIPYIVTRLHIYNIIGSRIITLLIYAFGVPAGIIGPLMLPRLGLKRLGSYGFIIAFISLIGSGLSIYLGRYYITLIFMVIFIFGNHWNNQPLLTAQALVSSREYRGTAIGLSNFIGNVPSFLAVLAFPTIVSIIGLGIATMLISIASLTGIIVSSKVFIEIYRYTESF